MFAAPDRPRAHYEALHDGAGDAVARRLRGALRRARPGLPRPGHHVLALGRGAAVPARPRAADHRRRRSGRSIEAGRAPAGARARGVPRRRLRPGRDPRRRRRAAPARRQLVALPPLRRRHRARRAACASTSPASTSSATAPASFRVLEDNLRTPSGISYVVENRRAMTHVFPELFASHRVRPVADYPPRLLEALRATAPPGRRRPERRGAHARASTTRRTSSTRSSPARWASSWSRAATSCAATTRLHAHDRGRAARRRRLPAHRRRLPRPAALPARLGARLRRASLNAARAGNVTIANAPGNGVADDKAVYPYVPAMIEYYLGEVPILANVETYRLEDPRRVRVGARAPRPARVQAGRRLRRLRPRDRAARRRGDARRRCARRCCADPRGWIAQEPVALSTAPTYVDGAMGAAPPRPPPVRGATTATTSGSCPAGSPGSRCPKGSLVVNSSQGGGSKDTWVLAGARSTRAATAPAPPAAGAAPTPPTRPRPTLGPLPEHDAQQQQQQQQTACQRGCAVLSRIAESLYWIGRYVERAEDTARLLDVHYHLLLEDRRADEAAVCRALLDAMGADRRARSAPSTDAATVDRAARARPDVLRARSRARSARRGRTRAVRARRSRRRCGRRSTPRTARSGSRARARRPVRRATTSSAGCATAPPRATGIVDATMSRDDGWRFLVLGRSLERVDMTARLLSRALRRRVRAHRLDDDAADAARRTRRTCAPTATRSTRRRAVEFLLLDRLFPRSVFHALTTAERPPRRARSPTRRGPGVDDEARRRLGPARGRARVPPRRRGRSTTCPPLLAQAAARVRRRARRDRPPLLPRDPCDRVERVT